MMRNYTITKFLLGIVLCAVVIPFASAQKTEESNSPSALELMKARSQWRNSGNSGGLLLDDIRDYSELAAFYGAYSGDFHRPQAGEKGNDVDFSAEGATMVGKLYTWGKFNYKRSALSGANYNASIIDPFRGMPYIAADTNRSDWRNQSYDMAFRVATPKLMNRLSLGVEVGYTAQSGAKQRDIRTENYFYKASVRPGIVFSFNEQHHLGANFEYFNQKEEANPSNVNAYVDQQYYVLYGLGNAVSQVGSGRLTNYEGDNIGAGLQYNYQGFANLLLSGSYNYKVESVELSFTTPRDDASVIQRTWNANLQLYEDFNNVTHYLTADYLLRHIDGVEAITQYDNTGSQNGYVTLGRDIRSTYQTQTVGMMYDVTVNRDDDYLWKLGASIRYYSIDNTYLTPHSGKNAENMIYHAHAQKNIIFASDLLKRRVLLAVSYDYSHNLSGGYEYNGSHADYPVVTQFERIDTDYLNTSYSKIALSAIYSQQIRQDRTPTLFVKGNFSYCKPSGNQFNDRQSFGIAVGCNF